MPSSRQLPSRFTEINASNLSRRDADDSYDSDDGLYRDVSLKYFNRKPSYSQLRHFPDVQVQSHDFTRDHFDHKVDWVNSQENRGSQQENASAMRKSSMRTSHEPIFVSSNQGRPSAPKSRNSRHDRHHDSGEPSVYQSLDRRDVRRDSRSTTVSENRTPGRSENGSYRRERSLGRPGRHTEHKQSSDSDEQSADEDSDAHIRGRHGRHRGTPTRRDRHRTPAGPRSASRSASSRHSHRDHRRPSIHQEQECLANPGESRHSLPFASQRDRRRDAEGQAGRQSLSSRQTRPQDLHVEFSNHIEYNEPSVLRNDVAPEVLQAAQDHISTILGDVFALTSSEILSVGLTLALTRSHSAAASSAPQVVAHVGEEAFKVACLSTLTSIPDSSSGPVDEPRGTRFGNQQSVSAPTLDSSQVRSPRPATQSRQHAATAPPRTNDNRHDSPSARKHRNQTSWSSSELDEYDMDLDSDGERLPRTSSRSHVRQPYSATRSRTSGSGSVDNLDEAFDRMKFQGPASPSGLSAQEAALAVSAPLPHFVPNTSQNRRWSPQDKQPHILQLFGKGTVSFPYKDVRSFDGQKEHFTYYVSFGPLISTPPIPPQGLLSTGKDLASGDIYIHINNELDQISIWQLVPRQNAVYPLPKDTTDRTWLNVSRSYVDNNADVSHPFLTKFVLAAHLTLKPTYVTRNTITNYIAREARLLKAALKSKDTVAVLKEKIRQEVL
ncbi:hypothetical protein BJ165DRAFT_1608118 [Panaeolus papilionaceus]|nr:hypothetical protein BJ165DRAFT_1608118 [Panaeolus papilionaceus]